MKPVLARQMEVYAGFLEHTDYHVGRLIEALEDLEILDDTLIYYIIGDNGASAEGTLQGTFNEYVCLNGFGFLETPEILMENLDKFGTPAAYNHYAVGWAHAMDTPYQWTKQVASPLGRHAQRHDRPLAQGHQGQRGGAQPVLPRDRRGADGPGGGGPARAGLRQRHPAEAVRRREHGLLVRRCARPPSGTRPSTSR